MKCRRIGFGIGMLVITLLLLPPLHAESKIDQKYECLGGQKSFLGKPTTGEAVCPDGIGRMSFEIR